MEGTGEVSMRDLVKNSLRMRPDRIVVGECRGGETLDMLQAMNTGHDGSMTTAHANSPIDMMKRLETMVLTGIDMPVSAIRNQIVSAVNIVVQLNRLSSGARKVTHISEVHSLDFDTGEIIVEDVFVFNQTVDGGYHAYTGYIPTFMGPMVHKGLIDPAEFF
jgi:pilus assembly protein CpaF